MKVLTAHSKGLVVEEAHIDELNHVNNVQYLSWVQDIAREHWEISASEDIRSKVYWVVVNHFITYKRPCMLHESIMLKTQVADDRSGATWGRNVWIMNQEGKVACEAFTKWCLMDFNTNRPTRITEELESIFISYD